MGTNSTGCTEWERDFAPDTEQPPIRPVISAAQRAYALLWRDMGPKSREVKEARAVLLASLTKDEQREAIGWIQTERPVTEREIMEIAARAEPC